MPMGFAVTLSGAPTRDLPVVGHTTSCLACNLLQCGHSIWASMSSKEAPHLTLTHLAASGSFSWPQFFFGQNFFSERDAKMAAPRATHSIGLTVARTFSAPSF